MGLPWGGYANGRIPLTALAPVPNFKALPGQHADPSYGSNLMKAEAATQLSGMMQAFHQAFPDAVMTVSEGYRPVVPVQDWYYTRFMNRDPGWTLAAIPGTSIHGWGLSADLAVNGGNPSGAHLAWLRAHAGAYGFVNDVASEVWHWSYRLDLVVRTIIITKPVDPHAAPSKKTRKVVNPMSLVLVPIANTNPTQIHLVSTETGKRVHVESPSELVVLKRLLNNDGTDQMLASEIDRMKRKYISKVH